MKFLDAFSLIFVAGNVAILVASAPNIYRMLKTRDVRSYSTLGAALTFIGLAAFELAYVVNIGDMWVSFLLNTPNMLFWGAVAGWKIIDDKRRNKNDSIL